MSHLQSGIIWCSKGHKYDIDIPTVLGGGVSLNKTMSVQEMVTELTDSHLIAFLFS